MSSRVKSAWRVPRQDDWRLADQPTRIADETLDRKALKKKLKGEVKRISALQEKLYAHDHFALLCVFQAMDAAGKDSTIRAVFTGVNPAGFQVSSFKKPSDNELEHDFLWRTARALPQRGRIGVFNRSYYEEVLVVRVHPAILSSQRLPADSLGDDIWRRRLRAIADHERHLVENGTQVIKFFLNVSREEQAARFLSRLEEPEKNWKFSANDLNERQHWERYMSAYEAAMQRTSTRRAPWYSIPADDKPRMRYEVAKVIRKHLEALPLEWPKVSGAKRQTFQSYADQLRSGEL
ncbi:MAG: PPK2 family polyphosphate kinase [Pseudomonadota bacterium]